MRRPPPVYLSRERTGPLAISEQQMRAGNPWKCTAAEPGGSSASGWHFPETGASSSSVAAISEGSPDKATSERPPAFSEQRAYVFGDESGNIESTGDAAVRRHASNVISISKVTAPRRCRSNMARHVLGNGIERSLEILFGQMHAVLAAFVD